MKKEYIDSFSYLAAEFLLPGVPRSLILRRGTEMAPVPVTESILLKEMDKAVVSRLLVPSDSDNTSSLCRSIVSLRRSFS